MSTSQRLLITRLPFSSLLLPLYPVWYPRSHGNGFSAVGFRRGEPYVLSTCLLRFGLTLRALPAALTCGTGALCRLPSSACFAPLPRSPFIVPVTVVRPNNACGSSLCALFTDSQHALRSTVSSIHTGSSRCFHHVVY
eukprot:m.125924 g.125924  ORF g.125924 m.125924 type:complete len:138 (-) comp52219_c0_seq2:1164-1577(-)